MLVSNKQGHFLGQIWHQAGRSPASYNPPPLPLAFRRRKKPPEGSKIVLTVIYIGDNSAVEQDAWYILDCATVSKVPTWKVTKGEIHDLGSSVRQVSAS